MFYFVRYGSLALLLVKAVYPIPRDVLIRRLESGFITRDSYCYVVLSFFFLSCSFSSVPSFFLGFVFSSCSIVAAASAMGALRSSLCIREESLP